MASIWALFYAEGVEVELKKEASVDIGLEFDIAKADVEVKLNTDTEKRYKITYKNSSMIPFGATFKKGKNLF